eukprot:scaffold147_cov124-Isochrysis_galbana.AAC.2
MAGHLADDGDPPYWAEVGGVEGLETRVTAGCRRTTQEYVISISRVKNKTPRARGGQRWRPDSSGRS